MDGIGPITNTTGEFATQGSTHAQPANDDARQSRESLTKAARTVNQANFAGAGREVTFSVNPATRRPVIKVVQTETKEVVAQWPSEYLLRLAEELDQSKRNVG